MSEREAKLEGIRMWFNRNECGCVECELARFLLSEIDRLKVKLEGEDE